VLGAGSLADVVGAGVVAVGVVWALCGARATGALCGADTAGALCAAGATVAAFVPVAEPAFPGEPWVEVADGALLAARRDPLGLCGLLAAFLAPLVGEADTLGVLAAGALDVALLLLAPPQPAISSASPTPPTRAPAADREIDARNGESLIAPNAAEHCD